MFDSFLAKNYGAGTDKGWTKETKITNIRGGKGRFDSCQTIGDVEAKLRDGEKISVRTYGGGTQMEVRKPTQSYSQFGGGGSLGIVATAELA